MSQSEFTVQAKQTPSLLQTGRLVLQPDVFVQETQDPSLEQAVVPKNIEQSESEEQPTHSPPLPQTGKLELHCSAEKQLTHVKELFTSHTKPLEQSVLL